MSGNTSGRTSSPTASLIHMTPSWTHPAMLGTSSSPNPNVSHQSQHEPGHYRSNPDAVGIIWPGLHLKEQFAILQINVQQPQSNAITSQSNQKKSCKTAH